MKFIGLSFTIVQQNKTNEAFVSFSAPLNQCPSSGHFFTVSNWNKKNKGA